ncbi:Regulator of nonsense transcripts 1 [Nymphon striatum]|nr:Regulator of nonsense transcripts 1 [Nymphon striatum]
MNGNKFIDYKLIENALYQSRIIESQGYSIVERCSIQENGYHIFINMTWIISHGSLKVLILNNSFIFITSRFCKVMTYFYYSRLLNTMANMDVQIDRHEYIDMLDALIFQLSCKSSIEDDVIFDILSLLQAGKYSKMKKKKLRKTSDICETICSLSNIFANLSSSKPERSSYNEECKKLTIAANMHISSKKVSTSFGIAMTPTYDNYSVYKPQYFGQVVEVTGNVIEIKIVWPNGSDEVLMKELSCDKKKWRIDVFPNLVTYFRKREALEKACFVNTNKKCLSSQIMNVMTASFKGKENPVIDINNNVIADASTNTVSLKNERLNGMQQQALESALTNAITLIQGPPGTGKTITAACIIFEWISRSSNSDQVLACAETNEGVDNIMKKLIDIGIDENSMIRVGAVGKGDPQLKNMSFEEKYWAAKGRKANHNFGLDSKIADKILKSAKVICTTCNSSALKVLSKRTFSKVLIDEAGQATEPAVLVPLVLGACQVCLVGDDMQLPPLVLNPVASSNGLSTSLFSSWCHEKIPMLFYKIYSIRHWLKKVPSMVKLFTIMNSVISSFTATKKAYSRDVNCSVFAVFVKLRNEGHSVLMLDIQYRMHPGIAMFPSKRFYDSKLKTGLKTSDRPLIKGFLWPNKDVPVAFMNVKSRESCLLQSKCNSKEADVIVGILNKEILQLNPDNIGIVTPYTAQVREIASKLKAHKIDIDVKSVDGFQGQERDLIIFSCVRANASQGYVGQIGFLKDVRRMNVLLTRAKRGLILVGHQETLQCDESWRAWLDWAKEYDLIVQVPDADTSVEQKPRRPHNRPYRERNVRR